MREITDYTKPQKWDKLKGTLLALQPRQTQYGDQIVCVLSLDGTGEIKEVYRTRSMSALTEKYLGCHIALVRKYDSTGKSMIRVYVDDKTPQQPVLGQPANDLPPETDEDYDPFAED